jgi:lysozyme
MLTDSEVLAIASPRVQEDEGLLTEAYLDGGGVPTIGVGHTGREVHIGLVWTVPQCLRQFGIDLGTVIQGLDTSLSWWRDLNAARGAVLVNIGFNVGVHGLLGFRKMLAAMERRDWETAAAEIVASTLAPARAQRLAAAMVAG